MLDAAALRRVVPMHQNAYRLFQWLNGQFRGNKRSSAAMTDILGNRHKAKTWLAANQNSFPPDLRAAPADLETFARLFVSFIDTSFKAVKAHSEDIGCSCVRWIVGAHLARRAVGKADRETAERMKGIFLEELAKELGVALSRKNRAAAAEGKELALATYGRELLRRSQFQSQGAANLALWQEIFPRWKRPLTGRFPWRKKPPPPVPITAELFLRAEEKLASRLRAAVP